MVSTDDRGRPELRSCGRLCLVPWGLRGSGGRLGARGRYLEVVGWACERSWSRVPPARVRNSPVVGCSLCTGVIGALRGKMIVVVVEY